jgi:hypothetical protein
MKLRLSATFSALVLPLLVTGPSAALADSQPMRMNSNITEEQVLNAQKGWCNGLLAISKAYATGGLAAANATANKILDQAYGYQYGAVAPRPARLPISSVVIQLFLVIRVLPSSLGRPAPSAIR